MGGKKNSIAGVYLRQQTFSLREMLCRSFKRNLEM
jgi:hypothetical protein